MNDLDKKPIEKGIELILKLEKGLARNLKQQQAHNKKIGQEVLLKNFQVIFILKKKEWTDVKGKRHQGAESY